jgi:hypothetical protein
MIFQILLTGGLSAAALYALLHKKQAPWVSVFTTLAVLVGVAMVWFPALANDIAIRFGIGRGADLLLYCWIVISFSILLNLHLKVRREQEAMTILARKFAILEATLVYKGAVGQIRFDHDASGT